METKLAVCTVCDGTGKQTIRSSRLEFDYSIKKWREIQEPSTTINCFFCKGTGVSNSHVEALISYEKNMWCRCGTKNGSNYYADNVHPEMSKHHFRCVDCGKVTQIG